MPQVPYSPAPTQFQQGHSGTNYQTGSGNSADAFGAPQGAALQRLGAETEKFGDVLQKHALKMQGELNQAEADNLTTDYVIAQAEVDNKFRSLEGKTRADGLPRYIEESRALLDSFATKATTESVRKIFHSETRVFFRNGVRNEATSAAAEYKKFTTDSNLRLLTIAEEMISLNPESEDVFQASLSTANRAVRQEANNRGWPPVEIEARAKQTESRMYAARISALAGSDPERAVSLFDEVKLKLTSSDKIDVESKIMSGRQRAGSEAEFKAFKMKQLVADDLASTVRTGEGVPGLSKASILASLGPNAAQKWTEGKVDAHKIWWHTNELATVSEADMQEQLKNITPKPGSPRFERDQAVFDAVEKMFNEQIALRQQDPARSVESDPIVKDIMKKSPQDKTDLISARLAAQTRAGIPLNLQSPITVDEAVKLMAPLYRALPGRERDTLIEVGKTFQKIYGEEWEQAFSFALKAQRMDAKTQLTATVVMRRLLQGWTPGPQSLKVDTEIENRLAQEVAVELTPTVPLATVPLSLRLLRLFPSQGQPQPGTPGGIP